MERRTCLSVAVVNVLVHHGGPANDGANLNETALSPTTVTPATFGKRFSTAVDGVVTAQPLYVQNVNVARGTSVGVHPVLFVATEHDSLYALDANTGAVLWRDSFLNTTDPTATTATTGVTTMPASEVGDNAGPELGIWSTPAIDVARGTVFLTTNTQEVRGTDLHFVQRLWAVRLTDGVPVVAPAVVGDTISNRLRYDFTGYTYVAGPIVNGTGNNKTPTVYPNTDGWASAPGGATGPVIAFNAVVQGGRPAVTLMAGNVYLAFASHVDQSPYYGWILGYAESNLAMTAAFVTTPTYEGVAKNSPVYTAQGGVWSAGSGLANDGTSLFVPTSPGAFNNAASNFDSRGFPIDHNYANSLLKLQADPTSTSTQQNGNGWGLAVADYFTPSNTYDLMQANRDLGSGAATLLPDNITDAAGHPVLVIGSKESRVYVLDRSNLGKFNPAYPNTTGADPRPYDRVVNEYAGDGVNGAAHGVFDAPAYLNGTVYVGQSTAAALAFNAAAMAAGQPLSPTSATMASLGYPGPTFTATANGSAKSLLWATDAAASAMFAYDASDLRTPIYSSNTNAGDAFAGAVKFGVPTVVNGMAYVAGTAATVAGYGLRPAALSAAGAFAAPTGLAATAVSPTGVHLTWTGHSTLASLFRIDRSTDGKTWTTAATVTAATTADDDAIAAGTAYQYRVVAVSGSNVTPPSNTAAVTTPLAGTVIGTAGSYQNKGNTIAKAFDGNLSTCFDAPTANGNWAGLDLGAARTITAVAYASRSGYGSRMNGGTFQGSTTADFSAGVVTLFTIPANANPGSTTLTRQPVNVAGAFRYVRYLSPAGSYGNVAELAFFGSPAVVHQLAGATYGTAGSYKNNGNTIAKATDGNLSTYFDAPTASGSAVGIDLGTATVVSQIKFAPRSGYASRMVGGLFQASNDINFTSGVVTVYTVSTSPASGTLTTVATNTAVAYRYWRYVGPANSNGNIAEFQLFGTA